MESTTSGQSVPINQKKQMPTLIPYREEEWAKPNFYQGPKYNFVLEPPQNHSKEQRQEPDP